MGSTVTTTGSKKKDKKPKYKIPFCPKCGHMQHYPGECIGRQNGASCEYGEHEFRDPDPFFDELEFVEMEKGWRSGAWAWYKSTKHGTMYCVTLAELANFIKNSAAGGKIWGRFGFRKKGNNFTLTWLPGGF